MRYKILDLDDDVDKNGFELIQLINQTLKLKASLIWTLCLETPSRTNVDNLLYLILSIRNKVK